MSIYDPQSSQHTQDESVIATPTPNIVKRVVQVVVNVEVSFDSGVDETDIEADIVKYFNHTLSDTENDVGIQSNTYTCDVIGFDVTSNMVDD